MKLRGINMFLISIWLWGAAFFLVITGGPTVALAVVLLLILLERLLAQVAIRTITRMWLAAIYATMKDKNADE